MTRTFLFRLYPNRTQVVALETHLSEACRLYNAALQERRDAWKMRRQHVTFYDQSKQLKEIRAAGDVGIVNFNAAEEVLRRVSFAFDGFFRRFKANRGRAGFPRFRSSDRYDSLMFRRWGFRLDSEAARLELAGIGAIKVKLHRQVDGPIKAVTIRREGQRWFASVVVDTVPVALPTSDDSVGIDVGLSRFATLSDGSGIENPRRFRAVERSLRVAQRSVARRTRGSSRQRAASHHVAALVRLVGRQRADFHHKVSRRIVNRYGLIAVEDLNVRGMARGHFAKSIHDAGWSSFINKLAYKAESAGREFVKVNPRGTSQRCPCGQSVPKALSQRRHDCPSCGLSVDRDHAAAMNILALGLSAQARSDEYRLPEKVAGDSFPMTKPQQTPQEFDPYGEFVAEVRDAATAAGWDGTTHLQEWVVKRLVAHETPAPRPAEDYEHYEFVAAKITPSECVWCDHVKAGRRAHCPTHGFTAPRPEDTTP